VDTKVGEKIRAKMANGDAVSRICFFPQLTFLLQFFVRTQVKRTLFEPRPINNIVFRNFYDPSLENAAIVEKSSHCFQLLQHINPGFIDHAKKRIRFVCRIELSTLTSNVHKRKQGKELAILTGHKKA
jgi:hypothetical protein